MWGGDTLKLRLTGSLASDNQKHCCKQTNTDTVIVMGIVKPDSSSSPLSPPANTVDGVGKRGRISDFQLANRNI